MNKNQENVVTEEVEESTNVVTLPVNQETPKTSKKEVFVGVLGILGIISIIAQAIIWSIKGIKKLIGKVFGKKKEEKPEEKKEDFNPDDYEDDGPIQDDDSEK